MCIHTLTLTLWLGPLESPTQFLGKTTLTAVEYPVADFPSQRWSVVLVETWVVQSRELTSTHLWSHSSTATTL